ncbi:hypothetical protein HMPREF9446_02770 [Bacteroides fluxus YIT 12057]|uniref:Uncharacterized protein n=1 Tax=Bacteroides fluxus YIT 12057 TaxID=763034 RepID=F3PVJ2_9BACE|nr:hypothetical protein HMPREF9446_02770 [Bacteroides fluxus YIT 12057]
MVVIRFISYFARKQKRNSPGNPIIKVKNIKKIWKTSLNFC